MATFVIIDRRLERETAWGTAEDIAAMARVDMAAAQAFVEQNRAQIGNYFAKSQRLSRPAPDGRGHRECEYFSPWFVRWAVTRLKGLEIDN